ncbi:MAG TPA: ATP-binding cassette domain-containing protein [Candidatus Faecaligallichristensenella faecipullorum]|nr:ATP-binding cassette domain-containing protein [Candidatus Faecaligallichristensenella faecipullorum]
MEKPAPRATAPSDTAVELKGVSKYFDQRQHDGRMIDNLLHPRFKRVAALSGVSFSLARGEFVAYAGPNGAGKSTTFKLLCGLLAPDGGSLSVLGMNPIKQRIPLMKRVGVLFGNRSELWWDHPVRASFEWKKTVWDIDSARYARMLDMVCDLLGVDELMDTFVRELSLGQRMRADLALMLISEPELVLLDEPTLGLDVLAKRQMIDFLKAINREKRTTILVTSHDMDDLTAMARRLMLIHQGQVAFDGPPNELTRLTGDRRIITLDRAGEAPELPGARLIKSEAGRHSYAFDGNAASIQQLLFHVAQIPGVRDIETSRQGIEEVIAQLYKEWKK